MINKTEYCQLFNDSLKRNETIIIGCHCSIRYSGRAESYLEHGDRIIIVKSDNALIVHQPIGNAPVNYMKPDTNHSLKIEDKKLLLKSQNLGLKEFMEIEIEKIHFFNSHKLEDGQNIIISGTEEDMAQMIYNNPELIEEGFKPVSKEEQTKYGFIDVMGVDKNNILTIIECKRYNADLGAVTQLRRYVEKIMDSKGIKKARGILAAPKITQNAEKMLKDWRYEFRAIRPPNHYEKFDKKQKTLDGF